MDTLLDVRNKRSADINSDHYLLVKMKLRTAPKKSQQPRRKRYLVGNPRDEDIRNRYACAVQMRLAEENARSPDSINDAWNNVKIIFTDSAEVFVIVANNTKTGYW